MTAQPGRPDVGDRPTTIATFTPDTANPAAVATTVTARWLAEDGTTGTLTPTQDAPNVWRIVWPILTSAGRWRLRIEATAGLIAAEELLLIVSARQVPA